MKSHRPCDGVQWNIVVFCLTTKMSPVNAGIQGSAQLVKFQAVILALDALAQKLTTSASFTNSWPKCCPILRIACLRDTQNINQGNRCPYIY